MLNVAMAQCPAIIRPWNICGVRLFSWSWKHRTNLSTILEWHLSQHHWQSHSTSYSGNMEFPLYVSHSTSTSIRVGCLRWSQVRLASIESWTMFPVGGGTREGKGIGEGCCEGRGGSLGVVDMVVGKMFLTWHANLKLNLDEVKAKVYKVISMTTLVRNTGSRYQAHCFNLRAKTWICARSGTLCSLCQKNQR